MKYVYVPEGTMARVDIKNNPQSVSGLVTSDFSTCNIIFLIGNEGRISLIHVDPVILASHIKKEIDWVGKGCKKYIYVRNINMIVDNIKELINKDFKIIISPVSEFAIAININNFQISKYDLTSYKVLLQNVWRHPLEWKFESILKLKFLYGLDPSEINDNYLKVIFDGVEWATPALTELKFSNAIVNQIDISKMCQQSINSRQAIAVVIRSHNHNPPLGEEEAEIYARNLQIIIQANNQLNMLMANVANIIKIYLKHPYGKIGQQVKSKLSELVESNNLNGLIKYLRDHFMTDNPTLKRVFIEIDEEYYFYLKWQANPLNHADQRKIWINNQIKKHIDDKNYYDAFILLKESLLILNAEKARFDDEQLAICQKMLFCFKNCFTQFRCKKLLAEYDTLLGTALIVGSAKDKMLELKYQLDNVVKCAALLTFCVHGKRSAHQLKSTEMQLNVNIERKSNLI